MAYDRYKNKEARKAYNREYQRKYMREYRKNNPYDEKKYRAELKLKVLEHLGGAFCSNCQCNEISILEINHINGKGNQERKTMRDLAYYRSILKLNNAKEKYNILCRVCNAQHYVEELLGINGHVITWQPK